MPTSDSAKYVSLIGRYSKDCKIAVHIFSPCQHLIRSKLLLIAFQFLSFYLTLSLSPSFLLSHNHSLSVLLSHLIITLSLSDSLSLCFIMPLSNSLSPSLSLSVLLSHDIITLSHHLSLCFIMSLSLFIAFSLSFYLTLSPSPSLSPSDSLPI